MIFKDWINERLAALGKKWSDLTKAGIGGQTSYNIQHGKYKSLKNDTLQKIALVLECCIGDVKIAIAESLREEAQNAVAVEPVQEPEPLPFDDLPEPEQDAVTKAVMAETEAYHEPEPEKKVPVKKEAIIKEPDGMDKYLEKAAADIEKALDKVGDAAAEAMASITKGISLGILPADDTLDDPVNHPAHYTQGGIECIEAIKASMTASEYRGYLKGNAMKYMWRYQHKGGVEDLKKARWYLDRLISEVDR